MELDIGAALSVAITGLTEELKTERDRKIQLAQDVAYVQAPVIQIPAAQLPGGMATWGPNTSYVWAVQRITVSGFGATTDLVTAYRANSPAGVQVQNALFTFTESVAGAVATWHPGRTGLILQPEESLAFGGTFTGTTLFASVDVIQLHQSKLPYFLL